MTNIHNSIKDVLHDAEKIIIATHIRPDGDAIGSLLGLGLALEEAGKTVQMVINDPIPAKFRHLAGIEKIKSNDIHDFDLFVIVDCSDLERAGNIIPDRVPDLVIDHHITNLKFGKINLVEPNTVATTAILAAYMEQWGLKITKSVAEALLTGLITDTLGFRTSNMNPEALRIAADLMDKGADLTQLYQKALLVRSFEAVQFWATGLVQIKRENRLVWTSLTMEDRKKVKYPGKDDADLINVLSTIKDTDVAIIFVESQNKHVKVSWRAQPGFNISGIALQFGGGGHPAAAGADIPGTLEEVQLEVLKATQEYLIQKSSLN